ncbi:hypothetical protein [Comamonas sp. 17RB]|uniref:hypothetical protein n=1 Tax=Comamonas sp. 17RB TaxID=3047025 RepID=UPI0024B78AF8|nr:hypothetical protein [Comamonas sp. 17RB]MDI9855774.1 hypothetical protein [Comamonas sp. 17RB]
MVAYQQQNIEVTGGDKAQKTTHAKKSTSKFLLIGITVATVLLIASFTSAEREVPANASIDHGPAATSAPKTMPSVEALDACRMLIRRAAYDSNLANVPYIEGAETSTEFTFTWDSTTVLASAPSGANDPGVTASCSVNKVTRAFTKLSINGQNIALK